MGDTQDAGQVHAQVPQTEGRGLEPSERAHFEQAFGTTFGDVVVHRGTDSSAAASRLHAAAYAVGNHVVLGTQAAPSTSLRGRMLMGHELAHVVQQRSQVAGPVMPGHSSGVEGSADAAGARAALGVSAGPVGSAPVGVARLDSDEEKMWRQKARRHRKKSGGKVAASSREGTDGIGRQKMPSGSNKPGVGSPAGLRSTDFIDVDIIAQLEQYTPAEGGTYRVGDAAASSVLMKIEDHGGGDVQFMWFNFARGEPQEGTWQDWGFLCALAISPSSRDFVAVGRALTASQWSALWPDPRPELLRLHEQGKINLPDPAVVEMYQGMVHNQALRSLQENERSVDALLTQPDRLVFFQRYAEGLREASLVRDALETGAAQVARRKAQMQGANFGGAGRIVNMDPSRRIELVEEASGIDEALAFWMKAFPLLSRLKTADIQAASVEATLRRIKQGIVETRAQVSLAVKGRGDLDLWSLDNVRGQVDTGLGPRTQQAIADEDASRVRWGWIEAGAWFVGGMGLIFVPGGAFIDAAIGVAMGINAVDRAQAVGHAANTGLDVDAGLISQSASGGAQIEAIFATIFAAIGAVGLGLRLLRLKGRTPPTRSQGRTTEQPSAPQSKRPGSAPRPKQPGTPAPPKRLEKTAEGLDDFGHLVWHHRETILRDPNSTKSVYHLYEHATEANPLSNPMEHARGVLDGKLKKGRPKESGIAGSPPFVHFYRKGKIDEGVRARVYVFAKANRATEVMDTIVKQIVDDPQAFPGAVLAKIDYTAAIATRTDGIVVYLKSIEEAERASDFLHATVGRDLLKETPHLTQKRHDGIAIGAEPIKPHPKSSVSFGGVRAEAFAQALRDTKDNRYSTFIDNVRKQLLKLRVDPDNPHLNLENTIDEP